MADTTKTATALPLLAAEHQGMRVDYIGLLWQCRQELEQNAPGYAEMLRQLQEHLRELGQRWYAGDTAVVDELLQLYSIEKDARQALQARLSTEAIAALPAPAQDAQAEPDPHGTRYQCERAALALGHLSDDELANGAFMNYDAKLDIARVLADEPDYHPPIVWMTAVKDRIRWLSRQLAAPAPVDAAATVPDLRERLAEAHDASLDTDHHACRAILMEIIRLLDTTPPAAPQAVPLTDHHKLDNDQQVFFYEQDFYVLSNFSSFALHWRGLDFPTSEHAYHWEKFNIDGAAQAECRKVFLTARSAHDAFKAAAELKQYRRADWDDVKVSIMRDILRAKAQQHEYVRRKLLATGDRELIEDSWRDDYWGWGPNRDGQNMLGKLWMEVRAGLRGITPAGTTPKEQQ